MNREEKHCRSLTSNCLREGLMWVSISLTNLFSTMYGKEKDWDPQGKLASYLYNFNFIHENLDK